MAGCPHKGRALASCLLRCLLDALIQITVRSTRRRAITIKIAPILHTHRLTVRLITTTPTLPQRTCAVNAAEASDFSRHPRALLSMSLAHLTGWKAVWPTPAPTSTRYPSPVPSSVPSSSCVDSNYGATNDYGYGCEYSSYSPSYCPTFADDDDFTAADVCCECGGGGIFGRLPTPSPSLSRIPTLSPTQCMNSNRNALNSYDGDCSSVPTYCPTFYDDPDFTAEDMCCKCGGGEHGVSA